MRKSFASNKRLKTFHSNENLLTEEKVICPEEDYQVFNVVWGTFKPGKKHKVWEEDGVLTRKQRLITLYTTDGKLLEKELCYKKKCSIQEDDIIIINNKECLIQSEIEKIDFENNKCFQLSNKNSNLNHDLNNLETDSKTKLSLVLRNNLPKVKKTFQNVLSKNNSNETNIKNEQLNLNCEALFTLPKLPNQTNQVELVVDTKLSSILRPHQKDGIIFLYECIMGFRENVTGCILADEMGLGKTLQCITLINTLLKYGPLGMSILRNVIILTPSSLVKNWSKEFDKWLKGCKYFVYAVDGKKKCVKDYLKQRKSIYPILIISYESFVKNAKQLSNVNFDLLICDEGHRLKNAKIKLCEAINNYIQTDKKIILTGTPIQNNLQELFALSNLVNPNCLGSINDFKRKFENPILSSREPTADEETLEKGDSCVLELADIIGNFTLRRTQEEISCYLPSKVEHVVICRLSEIQNKIYSTILNNEKLQNFFSKDAPILETFYFPYISFIRKLCNHPFLINESYVERFYSIKETSLIKELKLYTNQIFKSYSKSLYGKSGKFDTLVKMLNIFNENEQKVVVVSHFTQTLDIIQQHCVCKNYTFCRLDGKTPIKLRQKLVDEFNDKYSGIFVFLLSSKAGGCGFNLVGASNIILFDIDWNPAIDLQAMARIWRDGQKRTANIYRFLTVGSIEEKMFQRQIMKQGLNYAIQELSKGTLQFSKEDLKDIFTLKSDSLSSTHDVLNCNCLKQNINLEETEELEENSELDNLEESDKEEHFNDLNVFLNRDKKNDENIEEKLFIDNDLDLISECEYTAYSSQEIQNEKEPLIDDYDENSCDLESEFNQIKNKKQGDSNFSDENAKSILDWEHFAYPFANSELNSVLQEAKNEITFVFRNTINKKLLD